MRRTRAGTLTATLILGGVLVATAPMITAPSSLAAAHREAAGDEDRQLRIGVTTFGPETWDPILGDATTANAMHGHVFDWLVRLEHGRPAPGVLESFEMSADGSYWDLRLRSGLTFHDGSPATVDDLEFTIERYMSEEAIRAHMRDSVERTEVIDDLTLRVFLKEPNPYFPYYLSNTVPNQGSLMPKAYIEEHGLDYFLANPIGVGPYRLESQTVGVSHTYRAVEDHWRITPAFDTLTVSLVPDVDTQLALLETGDLDLVYVALDDVERLEGEGYRTLSLFAPATRIDLVASYDPRVAGMPTEDIRVREALARAIDYEAIEESLFHGRSLPRVPPRALFEMDEVDPEWSTYIEEELQSYDPERALALLEEAGYPNGFEIDLFVSQPAGIDYMNDLAETVQAYWSQVGVTANITNLELAEYNAVRGPVDRIVGSALFASTGVYGPAPLNMSWIWGSAGGQPIHAHLQEDGTLDVFLPELDEVMYGAIAELDPERRLELIDETIRMGLDTYTSIVFGQVPTTIAVAPGIDFLDLKEPLTSSSTPPIAEFAIPSE